MRLSSVSSMSLVVVVTVVSFGFAARAQDPATPPTAPAVPVEKAAPASETGPKVTVDGEDGARLDLEVDVGSDGDPVDMLARLPVDVREKMTGEQMAEIVRRGQMENPAKLESIIVPSGVFLMVVLIVALIQWSRLRRDARMHDTLRAMVEKGVEIPPALLVPEQPKRDDRRRGVLLSFVGVGLTLVLLVVSDDATSWAFGLVPLFIGIGYFVAYLLEQRGSSSSSERTQA